MALTSGMRLRAAGSKGEHSAATAAALPDYRRTLASLLNHERMLLIFDCSMCGMWT